jgi:hypothetical protein
MRLTPRQRQNVDSPAAQAEARELVKRASAMLDRGMPAQAMADADAVMAASVHAGPAGEPYLTARVWRAIALSHLGQHAAAAGEFARLIEETVPLLSDTHRTVVISRIRRAGELFYLGRYDEAEAQCRMAIKQSGKMWPETLRDTYRLTATMILVTVLNGRGLHTQAEAAARSAIRDAKGSPTVGPRTLASVRLGLTTGLASSVDSQHRHQEAERILRGLKSGSPSGRASIQLQLAAAQLGMGMPGDAEAAAREAITEAERTLGPAHYAVLAGGTLLGSAIARQGRPDEARQQLEANAEAWLEHFGEDHPKTIAAREKLARLGRD